jgi:hypothetical protein
MSSARDAFHARRSGRPGPRWSRSPSSIEVSKWKVLGFELWQSPHPSVGAVINEGYQTRGSYNTGSLGSLQEFHKITGTRDSLIPSLNWKHQNKKEPTILWFENMKEMVDWTVLDGHTSNHWVVIGTTNRRFSDSD